MLKTGEADKERLNIQSAFAEVPMLEALTKWQAEGLLGKDFSGKIILDFGCGTGSACLFLKKCFPNVKYQGIDLAADSIASAQDAYPNETFSIGNEHEQSIINQADIIFVRFVVRNRLI
jgi:ubiquinone/menaquinone biosynthesis C-methylase UbiE